ncbi:hypothetical protein Syun_007840 [Stephania yunnanensis]|uniref:Uncharacterized protein n=1 Tax=Stephania yunnanensis TaxID=152371 RepID=A0AAP0Q0M2_9MAGN
MADEELTEEDRKALRGSKFAPLPSTSRRSLQPSEDGIALLVNYPLAHPGGPLTTNKAAALAKFLERKLQEPGGLDSINPALVEQAMGGCFIVTDEENFLYGFCQLWIRLVLILSDDGSVSERESNDGPGVSKKTQRHGRGKFQANVSKGLDAHVPDLLQSQSAASNHGCLPLLKKRRSGGSRSRAVRKRTPRFPVSYLYDRHKEGLKSELDANDDEVAHVAVLALARASQRGVSPQLSQTPNRRSELTRFSVVHHGERMHGESGRRSSMLVGIAPDEDGLEGSLGSREAENADFEGLDASSARERAEAGVTNFKIERPSPQGSRKRGRQLFFDESTALEALYTLADVSMQLAPAATVESESSAQNKEEKFISNAIEKSKGAEAVSANHQKDAMSSLKEGDDDAFLRVGESLESVHNQNSVTDFGIVGARCLSSQDSVHGSVAQPDSTNSWKLEPNAAVDASNPKANDACGLGELQIPSELISSCVATLFMIQTCTERQYPPADVAQILDSTVKSMQPCCTQNVPIYSEIQMCMGLIKNQILALIPS